MRLLICLALFIGIGISAAFADPVDWGTNAHNALFDLAFPRVSESCRDRMREGSAQVDAFKHQFSLALSYQHAMRAPFQTPAEAEALMTAFIETEYRNARAQAAQGRPAESCLSRGRALHPVQDSTSPAHEGFQVWDPYFHPWQVLEHGDQPFSKETWQALQKDRARLKRTLSLMRSTDQTGMAEH